MLLGSKEVFTHLGWTAAITNPFFTRILRICVYIFISAFEILYALESDFLHELIDPILEEMLITFPLRVIWPISYSANKTVSERFKLSVFSTSTSDGVQWSISGPIPALLMRMSMLSKSSCTCCIVVALLLELIRSSFRLKNFGLCASSDYEFYYCQ